MHDLRLVGVHEDGEHLLLADAEGGRFLLAIDDAVRAAVRRDRPHLGQLQIEIEGGLRPRDIQARIRAGATAEEVASLAGWPVEKVRRYEGPVLAEREHVAGVAHEVRLRRRSGSVTLGAEVSRRLTARGVDLDHVRWDAWRVDGDPWTVTVTFPAGGRERSARWHLDLAARSVSPGDDEARWLSEDQPDGEGPLAGARLTAVPLGPTPVGSQVYDVEVDGGIGSPGSTAHSRTERTGTGEALDLVSAMRARRQAGRGGRRRSASHDPSADPRHPGDTTGVHPAGRRRPAAVAPQPEPLDLEPTLMDSPPAAHPPAGLVPADEPTGSELTPLPTATSVSPLGLPLAPPEETPSISASSPRHWPLAEEMRRRPAPALLPRPLEDGDEDADSGPPYTEPPEARDDLPSAVATPAEDGPASPTTNNADPTGMAAPAEEPTGRHRHHDGSTGTSTSGSSSASTGPARSSRRTKRSSVPSWDDIMFGAKQD